MNNHQLLAQIPWDLDSLGSGFPGISSFWGKPGEQRDAGTPSVAPKTLQPSREAQMEPWIWAKDFHWSWHSPSQVLSELVVIRMWDGIYFNPVSSKITRWAQLSDRGGYLGAPFCFVPAQYCLLYPKNCGTIRMKQHFFTTTVDVTWIPALSSYWHALWMVKYHKGSA